MQRERERARNKDEDKGSQRKERERQYRGDSAQRGPDKGRVDSETRRRSDREKVNGIEEVSNNQDGQREDRGRKWGIFMERLEENYRGKWEAVNTFPHL